MFAGGEVRCQIVFQDNQRLCRAMRLDKSGITVKADSRCCSTCFKYTAQEILIYISISLAIRKHNPAHYELIQMD